MGLFKKIFIFVLFLFPLGEIIRINLGNDFFIKPLDLGIGVLILLWLIFKIIKRQKIKQTSILIPAVLFAIVGLFSLIINSFGLSLSEFFVSILYLIRWAAYIGVFFAVSDFDDKFKKRISRLLIFLGSLIVGLGYLQYFFYSDLRNLYYLGWDEHMYRMFSVFLDPNFAGAFFVLFYLFLINKFIKKKTISIGIILLLTLIAVFLTFSRSALIMLIVSSILLFTLLNRKKLVLILLGIIIVFLLISSRYFNIENINLFRIASSEARLETAANAIKIIRNNPILGVGFNAYRYAQFRYGFRQESGVFNHADAGTDNSLLFVFATTGILGFFTYIFLWLKIFKISSPLGAASIIGIFINSMFINSLFYPFIMLWLWIILGVRENK